MLGLPNGSLVPIIHTPKQREEMCGRKQHIMVD